MKLLDLKVGFLVAIAGFTALRARADSLQISATDSITTYTSVIASNTSCGPGCTLAELSWVDADFSFGLTVATSNGPGGPALLNVSDITVDSLKGTVAKPNDLRLEVTDTGFLFPVGPTFLSQTLSTNTPVIGAAKGAVTAQGFYSAVNKAFDVSGASTPVSSESTLLPGSGLTTENLITFASPFALTDEINISFTSKGDADVAATLSSIAEVPEPAGVVLTGTVMLLIAGTLRRRYRRA